MTGKTVMITGATGGIGLASAIALARAGAALVLIGRSEARGNEALEKIHRASGNERLDFRCADFDVVFVMTEGGPAGLSRTMALFFYEQTFVSLNPQYGAAIVVVMSVIIVVAFKIAQRIGNEETSG